ncbi:MAG: dihydroorotate dehydrogenase electron transfer subunit [Oligosphaeraceae bacterium]|nr:dihydroorotate dehydrogenase electron transfer subunit [Oligosphaeraceae bacterium]
MSKTFQRDALVLSNEQIQGDYYRMVFEQPVIADMARAGQFLHVQIPGMPHRILRRPFSISDVNLCKGSLSIVYKVVGVGTEQLGQLKPGLLVNLIGPRGNGFGKLPTEGESVLLGGGYGCAAIFLLAKRAAKPPLIMLGGRSREDIIMVPEFESLGCKVLVATDDGSLGCKGYVTLLLEEYLRQGGMPSRVAACGPLGMLESSGRLCEKHSLDGELSLDSIMCCGMGACFACVVKKRADNEQGWEYVRSCQEGPVFKADEVYWG